MGRKESGEEPPYFFFGGAANPTHFQPIFSYFHHM
jgi:hypothetical protein